MAKYRDCTRDLRKSLDMRDISCKCNLLQLARAPNLPKGALWLQKEPSHENLDPLVVMLT